jgi:membrane associated rhomboid family serine protease
MERTLKDQLVYQWNYGGVTVRLIAVNAIVYLAIQLITVLARLLSPESTSDVHEWLHLLFALPTDLSSFIRSPWTLFTSIFSHFSFLHFLMNMLFLYFTGKLFESFFDRKRLVATYLIGGIVGGIVELLAHQIFPALQMETSVIVGASGSVMALFVAVAIYRPNLQVNLFGLFPIRLIFLALLFVMIDFLSLGNKDATAHFAHLGGAIIGFFSVKNPTRSSNIITWFIGRYDQICKRRNTSFTVKKGGKSRSTSFKSDEEYNMEKKQNQAKTDAILDKIAKSGYESLTKAEKEFLFKQSKNG